MSHDHDHVDEEDSRVGIAMSGGGIRAAAFTLGALCRLATIRCDTFGFDDVAYLSTVSGSGYTVGSLYSHVIAAAQAKSDSGDSDDFDFNDFEFCSVNAQTVLGRVRKRMISHSQWLTPWRNNATRKSVDEDGDSVSVSDESSTKLWPLQMCKYAGLYLLVLASLTVNLVWGAALTVPAALVSEVLVGDDLRASSSESDFLRRLWESNTSVVLVVGIPLGVALVGLVGTWVFFRCKGGNSEARYGHGGKPPPEGHANSRDNSPSRCWIFGKGAQLLARFTMFLLVSTILSTLFLAYLYHNNSSKRAAQAAFVCAILIAIFSITPAKGMFLRAATALVGALVYALAIVGFAAVAECIIRDAADTADLAGLSWSVRAWILAAIALLALLPWAYSYITGLLGFTYMDLLSRAFFEPSARTATLEQVARVCKSEDDVRALAGWPSRSDPRTASRKWPRWLVGTTVSDFYANARSDGASLFVLEPDMAGATYTFKNPNRVTRNKRAYVPRLFQVCEAMAMSGAVIGLMMGTMDEWLAPLRFVFGSFNLGMGMYFPYNDESQAKADKLKARYGMYRTIAKALIMVSSLLLLATYIHMDWVFASVSVILVLYVVSFFPYYPAMQIASASSMFRTMRVMLKLDYFGVEPPYMYLTDGGHYENLGILPLLARLVPHIIVIDGEADPTVSCQGLLNAFDKARTEFPDYFATLTPADGVGLDVQAALSKLGDPTGEHGHNTGIGFNGSATDNVTTVAFTLTYHRRSPLAGAKPPGSTVIKQGTLLYIKKVAKAPRKEYFGPKLGSGCRTASGQWTCQVNYPKRLEDRSKCDKVTSFLCSGSYVKFPHHSTLRQQNYPKQLFKAYVELGERNVSAAVLDSSSYSYYSSSSLPDAREETSPSGVYSLTYEDLARYA